MAGIRKKAEIIKNECVACGSCVNICPRKAISIYKGVYADVNKELCVGCSKCMKICPASVIMMEG
jgi:ferredoxin